MLHRGVLEDARRKQRETVAELFVGGFVQGGRFSRGSVHTVCLPAGHVHSALLVVMLGVCTCFPFCTCGVTHSNHNVNVASVQELS